MDLDRQRFPTVALYLDRVGGLHMHPTCEVKASVVRGVVADYGLSAIADGLPAALLAVLRQPPPPNLWIPDVLSEAVLCAAYDFAFTSRAEAEAATVQRNLRLFQSPMYRALMVVTSPRMLLRATGSRWSAFHRGTTLSLASGDDHEATVVLSFPPHLFIPENPLDVRGGLEAALISAGSAHARVVVDAHTDTSITYSATF
jgi:hypothetical protein